MAKKFEIRNSTAEFLIFQLDSKEDGVQVLYKDETIWATQKAIATLFDVGVPAVSKHLNNIYNEGELFRGTTITKMEIVQAEGAREIRRLTDFYNLDAIISVGYRVNSLRATQFRQWCTYVLRQFAIRGYVIDKKRMENGVFLGVDMLQEVINVVVPFFCINYKCIVRNTTRSITNLHLTCICTNTCYENNILFI